LRVEPLPDVMPAEPDPTFEALAHNVRDLCFVVIAGSPVLSNELLAVLQSIERPGTLADFVATFLPSLSTETRQELLETVDVRARLRRAAEELTKETENLRLRGQIQAAVEEKVGKAQREFFLREQLKAIQKELHEESPEAKVVADLRAKIDEVHMPEAAKTEAVRELKRLEQIPVASAEYGVARTYLDWLVALPWSVSGAHEVDTRAAQQVLDEDHYDLERVKERIVEYLAVLKLTRNLKGPIFCFVGPPGVGKTSLGRSIARALGRSFVRISLGGMRDEAEIRGHRRTYVGALPGQIIQGLRRAATNDPVFMLDEIDKLGSDFRGDPASALLEVLDPEQNVGFRDHYVDVPFDLSKVLFITTANVLDPVAPALRDRMEVLELPGYTETEKLEIARRYLVPKGLREHGLVGDHRVSFTDEGLREIVRSYTLEAGVRGLERAIGAVCRKHARSVAEGRTGPLTVGADETRARLGAPRYHVETDLVERTRKPGVAVALAWTPQGGDVLFVEAVRMPRDRGDVTITGQLGQVMQESVRAALSWMRANGERLGIPADEYRKFDVHLHVPAGAVPKDGPSAGLVMAVALVSAFRERPVRPFVALTGEITLTGEVLPVGGIKEKVLAAKRSGVRRIVLPERNRANVAEDVPGDLREGLSFSFVSTIDEALQCAFENAVGTEVGAPGELRHLPASPSLQARHG
jgi:ATP-dependent Lon protease